MMSKIVFASHVALINGKEYDGIGNVLKTTLNSLIDNYVFVRNSIDGKLPSEVQYFESGKIANVYNLRVASWLGPLRYASEYYKTVKYFSRHSEAIDAYVAIDPLNALSAIRLKNKGKVKKVIFYTADYSPKRFGNLLLNYIYHAIDKYCVKRADEVWSVSTRICEVRRDMGLSEERNIFVPNVPPVEYDKYRNNTHNKYELITTGIIDDQLDFEGTIKALPELLKEYPALRFTIVGNGPAEEKLKQLATDFGIEERVEFTGRLPLDQALARQSTAGIGLALYTGIWGFNYYGDSTKCREYCNFGLPVISTDTHATVDELREYQAGVVVSRSSEDYIASVRDILNNYDKYSLNASKLGKKYSGIHHRLLNELINSSR